MVQEVRQIMLSADEVAAAIENYRQMTPEFLPAGKITRCGTNNTGAVEVSIEITRDGFTRASEFTLRPLDMLRPLIGFCLKNGIPLPKDGLKTALVAEGSVALYVTRNIDAEVPAWAAPMRLDQVTSASALASPGDISLGKNKKSGT